MFENCLCNKYIIENILINLTISHYLAFLVIFLIYILVKYLLKNNTMLLLFNIAGVVFHELSHFVVALLLNGKPNFINLIPNKKEKSAGSVQVDNVTFYNKLFIGLAPLSLLFAAYYIFIQYFISENIFLKQVILSYIIFNLILHSIPSKQDLKIAFL